MATTKKKKQELARRVIAEKATLPQKRRRRLYTSRKREVEQVSKQIGKRELLFGGDGRYHLPGTQRSKLFRKPAEIPPEESLQNGQDTEKIIIKTLELSALTKAQAFERLEELGKTKGLDPKESSKFSLVKALAVAELSVDYIESSEGTMEEESDA